jgi:hypothetical protein
MSTAQQWLEEVLDLAGFHVGVEASPNVAGEQWLTIDSQALTPGQVMTLIGTEWVAVFGE